MADPSRLLPICSKTFSPLAKGSWRFEAEKLRGFKSTLSPPCGLKGNHQPFSDLAPSRRNFRTPGIVHVHSPVDKSGVWKSVLRVALSTQKETIPSWICGPFTPSLPNFEAHSVCRGGGGMFFPPRLGGPFRDCVGSTKQGTNNCVCFCWKRKENRRLVLCSLDTDAKPAI